MSIFKNLIFRKVVICYVNLGINISAIISATFELKYLKIKKILKAHLLSFPNFNFWFL